MLWASFPLPSKAREHWLKGPMVDPQVVQRMIAVRRDLHRHPELSWQESRTAESVAQILGELGIQHFAIADTGVVADLPGRSDVPKVALRADLDALPIQEETGLPFASVTDGVMHACGHDGHTSMLLGAAEMLGGEAELPAPVRLIFQPAEETGVGAKRVVEEGALDGVGMIFGGHIDARYPTGTLLVTDGPVNASTDPFTVRITGQSAHAARPHEGVDTVVVGSHLVTALQTIVSREVNPAHPAVVTVGKFTAGTAENVIAGSAMLEGTIRTQTPAVRTQVVEAVRRTAEAVATLHRATVAIEFAEGTPAVINPPGMAALAREAAADVVGSDAIGELRDANMGAEDFSFYLEAVSGAYVRFGALGPGRQSLPAHSGTFDFDEDVLAVGAAWYREMALLAGRRLAASAS